MITSSFLLFVFLGLFSPGPNVIMLIASGARFGVRRTIPHIAGVVFGVGLLAGTTGMGLGFLIMTLPQVNIVLRLLAAGWIFYLGFRLYASLDLPSSARREKPFTFVEAVLFQLVNPKVWAVAMAASGGFSLGLAPAFEGMRMALAFAGINLMVCTFYTISGGVFGRLFATPVLWRRFMVTMAILMGLSGLTVFL